MAESAGGVLAVANPWDNLVRTGIVPWPPPEIVQKLYKSTQLRAFCGENKSVAQGSLGYYSDLQSLHSVLVVAGVIYPVGIGLCNQSEAPSPGP